MWPAPTRVFPPQEVRDWVRGYCIYSVAVSVAYIERCTEIAWSKVRFLSESLYLHFLQLLLVRYGKCMKITLRDTQKSWYSIRCHNQMSCNPSKCKKLVIRKKNNDENYAKIRDIPQCDNLLLLGVTLQSDCKFNEHAWSVS